LVFCFPRLENIKKPLVFLLFRQNIEKT
jgi:hypothetical protein